MAFVRISASGAPQTPAWRFRDGHFITYVVLFCAAYRQDNLRPDNVSSNPVVAGWRLA